MKLNLRIGDRTFSATLADTDTARAFAALLPMTLDMDELNGNEKYHYLSSDLPTAATRYDTIENGDLMLWNGNCVVLFYKTFSSGYSYTPLGKLDDPAGLAAAVGGGGVQVTFTLD